MQADAGTTSGHGTAGSSPAPDDAAARVAAHARPAPPAGGAAFAVHAATGAAPADTPTMGVSPAQPVLPEADTVQRLVQTIQVQFRQGIGEAVVRLRPQHLGEVSVALRVEQQSVSAVFRAEVPAVRQWLEAQEPALRQGLSQQGLTLDKFVVREDESRRQQPHQDADDPHAHPRRPPRPNRSDDEPRFEVVI